jgi:hypothetical protein
MTNKYVFVLEIQQLLYSSQEKKFIKKNHQEGPAATLRTHHTFVSVSSIVDIRNFSSPRLS